MGDAIGLTAGDGHAFSAYEAAPTGSARGGLVVIQEIFGINAHMRRVADGYARGRLSGGRAGALRSR